MKTFHSEQIHGFTLIVGQEWDCAGLFWQLNAPTYTRRSSGRFYLDSCGEKIHGATIADVVLTARNSAVNLLESEETARRERMYEADDRAAAARDDSYVGTFGDQW